jgi:hypothetical protein
MSLNSVKGNEIDLDIVKVCTYERTNVFERKYFFSFAKA